MDSHIVRMIVAVVLWVGGFLLFGRFISPRWKVAGKLAFYLVVSWVLSMTAGNWSLIWIVGHPLVGVAAHAWWCRRNGINWVTCEPRDRYLQLRPWAQADGFSPKNETTDNRNR